MRGGEQWANNDPRSVSVKSARNWRGSNDLTSSILTIGAACAISMSLTRGPRSTVMQNRDTNLESPDSIAIHRWSWRWEGDGDCGLVGMRNRIESNRCFQPHSSDANASIQRISFLFLSCVHSRSFPFVPVLLDRSVFLSCILSLTVGRRRICPCAVPTAWKNGRAKEEKREADVGAGNAHAYVRRRAKILLTL